MKMSFNAGLDQHLNTKVTLVQRYDQALIAVWVNFDGWYQIGRVYIHVCSVGGIEWVMHFQ